MVTATTIAKPLKKRREHESTQARERTGDRERGDDTARRRNSGKTRGLRFRADRVEITPPGRPPQGGRTYDRDSCGDPGEDGNAEGLRRRQIQKRVRKLISGDVLTARDMDVDAAIDPEGRERRDDRGDASDRD